MNRGHLSRPTTNMTRLSYVLNQRAQLHQNILDRDAVEKDSLSKKKNATQADILAAKKAIELSKAFSKLTVTTFAVKKTFDVLDYTIDKSINIISEYGRFSAGGMRAIQTEYIGDLRRNIRISREISNDMLKFAIANTAAKDSFTSTIAAFNKTILQIGEQAAGFLRGVGNAADAGINKLKNFGDNLGPWQRRFLKGLLTAIPGGGFVGGFVKRFIQNFVPNEELKKKGGANGLFDLPGNKPLKFGAAAPGDKDHVAADLARQYKLRLGIKNDPFVNPGNAAVGAMDRNGNPIRKGAGGVADPRTKEEIDARLAYLYSEKERIFREEYNKQSRKVEEMMPSKEEARKWTKGHWDALYKEQDKLNEIKKRARAVEKEIRRLEGMTANRAPQDPNFNKTPEAKLPAGGK